MLKKNSELLVSVLFFFDLLLLGIAWNLAYYLRFDWVNIPAANSIPDFSAYFGVTGIIMILGAFCFTNAKMYSQQRIPSTLSETLVIIKANIFLFILLTGISFYYREFSYSRIHTIYAFSLSIVLISFSRLVIRAVLKELRKQGKNIRRVLIIGNSYTAERFYQQVKKYPDTGLEIIGYVSPEKSERLRCDRLGNYQDLQRIIEEKNIDQVYIALDFAQQADQEEINQQLAEEVVDIHIVPDIYHSLSINPEVLDFYGVPVIALIQSPVGGWNRIIKRAFDLTGAIVALILFSPVMSITALMIKIFTPGPLFYFQERMGLDGVCFDMIKFRTMKVNAEAGTGAVWAKENDDRRTWLGSFLRSTSLDELPQLINVLQGNMSLVGPRPERPVFIKDFKTKIPSYMLRHKMKAGITGWAQVSGWRGNTSLEKRIEFDIYYLTHWSIWFDIKILFLTVFKGFVNKNAY